MLPWWTGPPCTARDVERLKVLKLEALGLQSTSKEMGTNGKGSRYLHTSRSLMLSVHREVGRHGQSEQKHEDTCVTYIRNYS